MNGKTIILVILLAIAAAGLRAGNMDQLQGTVVLLSKNEVITENINGANYELWHRDPSTGIFFPKQQTSIGTGFLIKGEKCLYLATAQHISAFVDYDCKITFRGANNLPVALKFEEFLKPQGINQAIPIAWINHERADCSIHPLVPSSPGANSLSNAMVLPMMVIPALSDAPSRDITLTTLGFALGNGAQVTFSPVTKESKAASGLLSENSVVYFLLQDPSISGFSGAPVFDPGEPRWLTRDGAAAMVGGQLTCWGIISRTDSDATGGKMARVIHAGQISEMIKAFEEKMPKK